MDLVQKIISAVQVQRARMTMATATTSMTMVQMTLKGVRIMWIMLLIIAGSEILSKQDVGD